MKLLGNSPGRGIVAQSVGVHVFLDASVLGGFVTCVPNSFDIDGPILAIVAGKKPSAEFPVVVTPVGAKCRE